MLKYPQDICRKLLPLPERNPWRSQFFHGIAVIEYGDDRNGEKISSGEAMLAVKASSKMAKTFFEEILKKGLR